MSPLPGVAEVAARTLERLLEAADLSGCSVKPEAPRRQSGPDAPKGVSDLVQPHRRFDRRRGRQSTAWWACGGIRRSRQGASGWRQGSVENPPRRCSEARHSPQQHCVPPDL